MRTVIAEPLTAAEFARYGDVLEAPATPGRTYFDAGLASSRPQASGSLSIAHIAPTPGSLGSWVGRTLGVPILTLEYHRGHDPVSCWLDTREAILSVILSG